MWACPQGWSSQLPKLVPVQRASMHSARLPSTPGRESHAADHSVVQWTKSGGRAISVYVVEREKDAGC